MRRVIPALAVLLGLIAATPAHAASRQSRIFEDDRLLIYSGPAVRAVILDQARAMGVDVIRAQFVWRNIALSKPKDPSDPNAYGNAWSNWDSLVIEARRRGMQVLATVTGPAPSWAAGTTDRYFAGSRYPSSKQFGQFMTAVGRRYSGGTKVASAARAASPAAHTAQSLGPLDDPLAVVNDPTTVLDPVTTVLDPATSVLDPVPCTPVPPVISCGPDGPVLPPPPDTGGGGGGGGGGGSGSPPPSGSGDQSPPPPPGSGEPTPPPPPGTRLPRVSLWSIYNEPNHPLFLSPQRRKGVLVAPSLYRGLYRAGWKALRKTGHRRDTILMGETLPIGSNKNRETSTTSPLAFARELFCLNGGGKRHPGCGRRYAKLHASGWAIHPYYRRTGPFSRPPGRSDVTPITVARLQALLAKAARRGRVNHGVRLWDTENGAQTRPPDPKGASLERQARFINEAEYIAWRNPRMRSFSQYLLVDEGPVWAFQSGLRFESGKAKPALVAYTLPIYVSRARGRATVWGRIPPGGSRVVTIHPSKGKDVQVRVRGARGYFTKRVRRARTYQLRYEGLVSRTAG